MLLRSNFHFLALQIATDVPPSYVLRYTVRVHACNKAGTSPAAEVTVRTGPTVPGRDAVCGMFPLVSYCPVFGFLSRQFTFPGVPEPPRVSRRPGQLKLRWEQPEEQRANAGLRFESCFVGSSIARMC